MVRTKIPRNDNLSEKWGNCCMCSSDSLYRPKSGMVKEEGKWYCKWHYNMRYRKKREDDYKIEIDESDRYQE